MKSLEGYNVADQGNSVGHFFTVEWKQWLLGRKSNSPQATATKRLVFLMSVTPTVRGIELFTE